MDAKTETNLLLQAVAEKQRDRMGNDIAPKPDAIAELHTIADAAKTVTSRLMLKPAVQLTEEQKQDRDRRQVEWNKRVEEGRVAQEQHQRQQEWRGVAATMGPKHANKKLSDWKYFGSREAQQAQRENIGKLTAFIKDMPQNIASGKNLVWTGTRGTGKDHQMSACLRAAILSHGFRAKWMYGPNLFLALRGLMSKGSKETEQDLIGKMSSVPILALSDPLPTVGGLTPYQGDALLAILDERYRHERPTWTTLNIEDRADAEARLGSLLVDRLFEHSLILYSAWPSYRQHLQVAGDGGERAGNRQS